LWSLVFHPYAVFIIDVSLIFYLVYSAGVLSLFYLILIDSLIKLFITILGLNITIVIYFALFFLYLNHDIIIIIILCKFIFNNLFELVKNLAKILKQIQRFLYTKFHVHSWTTKIMNYHVNVNVSVLALIIIFLYNLTLLAFFVHNFISLLNNYFWNNCKFIGNTCINCSIFLIFKLFCTIFYCNWWIIGAIKWIWWIIIFVWGLFKICELIPNLQIQWFIKSLCV
jgi:hypothetical protein